MERIPANFGTAITDVGRDQEEGDRGTVRYSTRTIGVQAEPGSHRPSPSSSRSASHPRQVGKPVGPCVRYEESVICCKYRTDPIAPAAKRLYFSAHSRFFDSDVDACRRFSVIQSRLMMISTLSELKASGNPCYGLPKRTPRMISLAGRPCAELVDIRHM
jgi:hypothetical protein